MNLSVPRDVLQTLCDAMAAFMPHEPLIERSGAHSDWREMDEALSAANQLLAAATPRTGSPVDDWVERLGDMYGCRQMAVLRGDTKRVENCTFWLMQIADKHWHEIVNTLNAAAIRAAKERG